MVGDAPHVLALDHVGGDAGLVLPHVGERGATVAVADGIQPATLDPGGAQLIVDVDGATGLEPDGLESEIAGGGPAAGGDEQLVRIELRAVVEHCGDGAVAVRARTPRRCRRRRGR